VVANLQNAQLEAVVYLSVYSELAPSFYLFRGIILIKESNEKMLQGKVAELTRLNQVLEGSMVPII